MHPMLDFLLLSSGVDISHYQELNDTQRLWAALQGKAPRIKGWSRKIEVSFTARYQEGENNGTIRSPLGAIEIEGKIYSLRGGMGWNGIRDAYLEGEWVAQHRKWTSSEARWIGSPQPLVTCEEGNAYALFQKSVAQWQARQLQTHTATPSSEELHINRL